MDSEYVEDYTRGFLDARNGVPLCDWECAAYVDGHNAYVQHVFGSLSLSEGVRGGA